MLTDLSEMTSLFIVLLGAFAAGFITGFAGFGTALIAAGFWFHALPAPIVPPLVAFTSVAGHLVNLASVRTAFNWRGAAPFLLGGVITVPLGVLALSITTPDLLRLSIGIFLVTYVLFQGLVSAKVRLGLYGGKWSDGIVGLLGGFLGGFAGLSGAIPVIWMQLRGGTPNQQRAIYQPFNFVVLLLTCFGMSVAGVVNADVMIIAGLCLPITMAGSWIGGRAYAHVSASIFRRTVLCLLFASGVVLVGESLY